MDSIIIKGLRQNNLKNISLSIPKNRIVVFTGVSGSGKSSIVFDTVAAESCRQMNETYPVWVRGRLPKYEKPEADRIENLTASVIVDQPRLSGNARSTVGTISGLYPILRILFSVIGVPHVGPASFFSFNDPNGMCGRCSGLGKVMKLDLEGRIDPDKTWNEGMADLPSFRPGNWYWKKYRDSGLFPADKKYCDFTRQERNRLLYGADEKGGKRISGNVEGIEPYLFRILFKHDPGERKEGSGDRLRPLIRESVCPFCRGKRLNRMALTSRIHGDTIADLAGMELTALRRLLSSIRDPSAASAVDSLILSLTRLIDIGLGYLGLDREAATLSGGEAQRLKLVRYMGSSLTGLTYIFDEPSTGMHPWDVYRMIRLLRELRDKGNTVLVVEHDRDIISIADEVIDLGPQAGARGGEIMFRGTYEELLRSDTLTGRALSGIKAVNPAQREPKGYLPVRDASIHNLKNIDVDIPLGVLVAVTGVAGSGKSSLIRDVFAMQYPDRVVLVDQSPITATNRSAPVSFLGIFDEIRGLLAKENGVSPGMFSFNSEGGCPECGGKGVITTELAFMNPVSVRCEVCDGKRYSSEALSYRWHGRNIAEILEMSAEEALVFFSGNRKIRRALSVLNEVGLGYLPIGQPTSVLSGGERQRLKLAKYLGRSGSVFVLDEPTTGLHGSDTERLLGLFGRIVDRGNTVIVIEHDPDVIRSADYIIDLGPDGGRFGGEVVFTGTPMQMADSSDTITAKCLRPSLSGKRLSDRETEELTRVNEHASDVPDHREEEEGMKLNGIGVAECDRGSYRIILGEKYRSGLEGLAGFSHLQVLWWFSRCDCAEDRSILILEKPYTKGPERIGTFATRSPQRPNPIALSVRSVKKLDPGKGVILLDYFDALTGSPILDIKPYTPSLDRVEEPSVPDWCAHWPKNVETGGDFDWEKEFDFPECAGKQYYAFSGRSAVPIR